jgi:hypothetical protein
MKRTASAIAATVAAVLLVPAAAGAETYCVEQPACTGTPKGDVQTALTAAAVSQVPDRIEIGPGSFFSDAGFIYLGAGAANTVDIVGAGTDSTELKGGKALDKRPALLLQGSAPAHVSRLTVTSLPPSSPLFTGGLRIFGAADHVVVTAQGDANGVELLHGSSLSDSDVSVAGNVDGVLSADGEATVRNSSIEARYGGTAASALGSGKLTISHSKLNGDFGGRAETGGSLTIDDSLILASNVGVFAFDANSKSATVNVTNATIYGTDPSVTGARAYALGSSDSAQINLTSSVVAHVNTSIEALASIGGSAAIVARFSAYDGHSTDHTGTGSLDQGTSNLDTTTPGFVDAPNRDFRLAGDSPLRDAGDPSPAGGLAATDLAGNPRSTDGNADGTAAPDIGAFELQPPPPPPSAPPVVEPPVVEPPAVKPPVNAADPAPSILSASLTHRRFRVGRRATTFRIKLSEAARVKIVIRRGKRSPGTLERAARTGRNRIAFSGRIGSKGLKPGRYVATITATDAAGHRSKPRRLRFSVRA